MKIKKLREKEKVSSSNIGNMHIRSTYVEWKGSKVKPASIIIVQHNIITSAISPHDVVISERLL